MNNSVSIKQSYFQKIRKHNQLNRQLQLMISQEEFHESDAMGLLEQRAASQRNAK